MIVNQAPATSALFRSLYPDYSAWGLQEQLLASAVDYLAVANWQRSGAPQRDYPRPIPRPGVEPDTQVIGSGAIPVDEMTEWLGWK